MRILYIEDNATNVILVQRVANMGKHAVITYGDGREALDHFEQDKPDLILLDVQLRGALTGLDVAHTLRTKGCTVPIIAVTAYAMKGDRQRCLDAGCDDYLPKPISVAELVTVFKRYGDAAASGKPIVSTFVFVPAAATAPANPLPSSVLLTPATFAITAADASPSVTPSQGEETSPPSAVASVQAPSPAVDAVPVIIPVTPNPVTVVDPVAVIPPSDSSAQRTPAPMNAEP